MKHLIAVSSLALLSLGGPAQAATLELKVTNLTQGIYFTPLLLAAHPDSASLFEVGETASVELQQMAEGGALDGLAMIGTAIGADSVANPAGGLLAPGSSTTAMLSTSANNTVLSVVAMILPSNDAFVGLDNWTIPTTAGTYTLYLNAYDAGTEANDEIRGGGAPGMPGMPVPAPLESLVGSGGSGVSSSESNSTVHIHRGNLGDDDFAAGSSDIVSNVQRWLNPVAMLTVTVTP